MPAEYHTIIVPRISEEIEAICDYYIRKDAPDAAENVAHKIGEAIDSLEFLPRRARVHEKRRDSKLTVHALSVYPYIIYYRVDDEQRLVRIMTVRHGARRQPKRFRP